MRNIWHDIDPHAITPTHFTAVIEIPAGSKKKYELDKKTGLLRLDRILYTSTHYPANYGFIPRTYADDGDPLDVLVFCSETLDPMVEVDCYPIGTMRMIDGDAIDDQDHRRSLSGPDLELLQGHKRDSAALCQRDFALFRDLQGTRTQAHRDLGRTRQRAGAGGHPPLHRAVRNSFLRPR